MGLLVILVWALMVLWREIEIRLDQRQASQAARSADASNAVAADVETSVEAEQTHPRPLLRLVDPVLAPVIPIESARRARETPSAPRPVLYDHEIHGL